MDAALTTVAPAEKSAPARVPHLAALDGLRGIAILMVIWYHIWEISWLRADVPLGFATLNFNVFPETGSAGVDLFYFLSGFVIFFPYARTLFDGAPMQTLKQFAYRRALKIVPSYYLAIFLMIVLGFAHFDSTQDAVHQIFAHAIFMQNLWGDTWGGIDGVMWSLSAEVQFYLVFPLICWCAMRRPLLTFAALVAFGDVYRFVVLEHVDVLHEIDRLPGAIDLFAAGMFAAWAYRFVSVRKPELATMRALWTGIAIVAALAIYAILSWQFDHRYDPWWNLGWKAGFRPLFDLALVPLTLGSLFAFTWWDRILANRVFVFFALISYNLYLWHQQIAVAIFARHWIPFAGSDPHTDRVWAFVFTIVAFAASIAVAWLITAFVEQPLLRRKPFAKFVTPPRLTQTPAGNVP